MYIRKWSFRLDVKILAADVFDCRAERPLTLPDFDHHKRRKEAQ
jgi:hypothetical protein